MGELARDDRLREAADVADSFECLEVRRDDLRSTRLVSGELPEPGPREVVLRVDKFGLTANNVTYGVAGDTIGYWRFFPAADPGWGRLPVWGFGEVVAGDVDGCPIGSRYFGYFPMSTHLVVEPHRVRPSGFTDGAAHRSDLPGTYNRYSRTEVDPMYRAESEDVQAIFLPLFVTSFVLDDYVADHAAERVLVSSASSKTAAGMALCGSLRTGTRTRLVGLTSTGNVDFVERLGWYDEVVAYDDVRSLEPSESTVFVDLAGDAELRSVVHGHLGDDLVASLTVGMTHWEADRRGGVELPGPEPQLFFAPTQIEQRIGDWGVPGYQQRLGAAWNALLDVVDDWIAVVPLEGLDSTSANYERLLDGDVRPEHAFIVMP